MKGSKGVSNQVAVDIQQEAVYPPVGNPQEAIA
jgi:hypothetical protein